MAKRKIESEARNIIASILITQGVLVALFGTLALFWPGLTAKTFIILFGMFVLVWGLVGFVHSFLRLGQSKVWWIEMVFGALGLGLGVFLLSNPGVTGQIIILLVGLTLIVRGVTDLITGLTSKESAVRSNRLFYLVLGSLGVIAGIIVTTYPATTGLIFVGIFGFYLLLYGLLNIALAFRVRELK